MAYNEFAYFYDEFNGAADYDALYEHIQNELNAHGIRDGILADLGCGTGELTLMLTQAGYDMIGIDQSEEMLCVVRDKAEQLGLSGKLLLLRQDLLKLDLYGTIRGAVSTFDTFNHIPDLDTAIANAGFFMEKGGVFLFDMNTPYKHKNVLGENTFTFEEEDACCVWKNTTMRPTAGWRSAWISTTGRRENISMRHSVSTPTIWTPSARHWRSTALYWRASATVKRSAR